MVLVGDQPSQGGELIFAAASATDALLAFVVRQTCGLVSVALPETECERLHLPPMSPYRQRTDGFRCTVSVDAARGISTGISARDRAHTIRLLADRSTLPGDLSRPGHVLPVPVSDGGVHGFPEAAVELVAMSGRGAAAGLARIVSARDDRQLAGPIELAEFAAAHQLVIVGVRDVVDVMSTTLRSAS